MSFTYTGIWFNWGHGAVTGSTLTLDERNGGLLTAFLAIFVSATGAATWKITRYSLHQFRARQEYQDALHHQQQAIFRNSDSPVGASWQLMQLTWYWRSNATRSLMRTIPLAGLALLNLALFGVAAVLSSHAAKASGSEILIRSPNCGFMNLTDPGSVAGTAAYDTMDLNDTLTAAAYERACYNNAESPLQCGSFIQGQLRWTPKRNVTCPFSPEMCLLGDMTAYEMDTGLVDSHNALGINAPIKDRLQYRKVTVCSPIQTKDYRITINDTDIDSPTYNDTLIQFFYGPLAGNYTYQYNKASLRVNNGYKLTSILAFSELGPGAAWTPIAALRRTDADISLFFLETNAVWYEGPVNDPFYLATTEVPTFTVEGVDFHYYKADQYVSVLGCTDQHQFCNPATGKCTELTASTLAVKEIGAIGLTDAQYSTALRLDYFFNFLNTYSSVNSRGANALRASETVDGTTQIALPDDQWITEVSSWFAVSLAKLQQKVVQYATGPPYASPGLKLVRPSNKEQVNMCNNQIIRSQDGTISFSVLGVSIILIVGGILILTSLVIDTLVGFIRRTFHWKEHKSLQWTLDEKLQTLRMAYEEAGQGHWSGGARAVPVTEKGDRIGVPRPVDGKHPRLSQISGQPEQIDIGGDEMAEAEGLITPKQMRYTVDGFHVHDTRESNFTYGQS